MKIVFIAPVTSPFIDMTNRELGKTEDSLFIYHTIPKLRPKFWSNYQLSKSSYVCESPLEIFPGVYFGFEPLRECLRFSPNVIILHGTLSPSIWWVKIWARFKRIPVIIFTENFGTGNSWISKIGFFRSILFRIFFKLMYGDVKKIMAVGEYACNYFQRDLKFPPSQVVKSQYPVDMNSTLNHGLREINTGLTFLFPHRLVEVYDPLTALNWFSHIHEQCPDTKLIMNAFGALRGVVEEGIERKGLKHVVSFADEISKWEDLHNVYQSADVLLSTKHGVDESETRPWGISDWSIAEMDACASGMGLIVSRCSIGLNSLMDLTNSGFIIDAPDDISSVLDAVRSYHQEPGLLSQHGQYLRDGVRKFSVSGFAGQILGESEAAVEQVQ
jgi:glycosyltransferase involved in cell wall biosynthesis